MMKPTNTSVPIKDKPPAPPSRFVKTGSDVEEFKDEEAPADVVGPVQNKTFTIDDAEEDSNHTGHDDLTVHGGTNGKGASTTKTTKKEGPLRVIKKKKKNPNFADVENTGRWGNISKTEVLIVALLVVAIAVGVATALVVLLKDDKDNDGINTTGAITVEDAGPILTPTQQAQRIQTALNGYETTKQLWDAFGKDFDSNPYRRAAKWIVEVDDFDHQADILPRFALASLYMATGGPHHWNNAEGWLTQTPVCEWYGVTCDGSQIVEINLSSNNVQGLFPVGLVFVHTIKTLWMQFNNMQGHLPKKFFPDMPHLEFVYLQHNNFTGHIPDTFLDNGKLQTFYLHGNNFEGDFPDVYCPTCDDCEHPLLSFGIDCKANKCPHDTCCDSELNCFT